MGDGSWAERRGAVVKESLTHLPPSWLRPPTPIPRTHHHDTLLPSLSILLFLLHLPPPLSPTATTSSLSLLLSLSLRLHHLLSMPGWLAGCFCRLPSCLPADQVVPNTTKSIYPRCTQPPPIPPSPSPSFSLSFSTHPFERYADPHIDRGANPLCRKGWCRRYDPDGARCK